jgi:tellurite resistance protein
VFRIDQFLAKETEAKLRERIRFLEAEVNACYILSETYAKDFIQTNDEKQKIEDLYRTYRDFAEERLTETIEENNKEKAKLTKNIEEKESQFKNIYKNMQLEILLKEKVIRRHKKFEITL